MGAVCQRVELGIREASTAQESTILWNGIWVNASLSTWLSGVSNSQWLAYVHHHGAGDLCDYFCSHHLFYKEEEKADPESHKADVRSKLGTLSVSSWGKGQLLTTLSEQFYIMLHTLTRHACITPSHHYGHFLIKMINCGILYIWNKDIFIL